MVEKVDLKKYFSNDILETRGEDIDFLYDSILERLKEAKRELEYMHLYSYDMENSFLDIDNDDFTFNRCEETEKFAILLNFASVQIKELENVAFYLQQLKVNKLNKNIELGAVAE